METKQDRVILGEGCIYSTDSSKTQLNNNVVVCGGSGCGKTMSISEPRLLETNNSSLVITLSKRRLVAKYRPLFKKRGYNIWDLNFVDPAKSNIAYDPLAYVHSYTDIVFLAESIVMANPKKKNETKADPYWDMASVSLLSALIALVKHTKRDACFTDVLELHAGMTLDGDAAIETSLDKKFEQLGKKDPNCFALSCWKTFKRTPMRTAGCIFSSLNATLDTIFSPELRKMMAMQRKVDFRQLATEKTILFVSTSAVNPALHCFVNMFYGQMFKDLFEYGERRVDGILPLPVHVLCDDFATGSTILNFPQMISVFREKGISVTILLQSESQLESMYGTNDATTILNNCDSYVYMGGMDIKTARAVSERLDMPVNDILHMPIGKEIVFRRGQKPVITERYDVQRSRLYQKVTREYEEAMARGER